MASSLALHSLVVPVSTHRSPQCFRTQNLTFTYSQFLSSASTSRLKSQTLFLNTGTGGSRTPKRRALPVIYAVQSNFFRVLQTVWKVGKDGIEAGTNLVPDSVPRPVARVSVTVVALALSLFVLKSFLSTAFFVLGTMGLIYFVFLALNKDNGPKGGGGGTSSSSPTSVDESLEEARRIMEKYK
ncbi:uncharacterized protein LOC116212870 [Punica granatum]|uniref:Transmembrane protein n=2 Tax=Punica granatum TaxID=22663 RepID=A0A218VR22_PUNGR|nr:uncharacterized protein LOC116212870 [Punica granatum]OWM62796.1 hypothetical protein CDL15_Pgr020090 [Punica granatum]PKI76800.1 hypothetical protein CRG98_002786 [Punica granatum]